MLSQKIIRERQHDGGFGEDGSASFGAGSSTGRSAGDGRNPLDEAGALA